MCCVFTCCGWMIDLVQRLWTFAMSCCISSAIFCVMATSSISGIALGYNYSLAEYIDLKETNVSVYLKRGVFDDEIVDDLQTLRRSGGDSGPNIGFRNNDRLITGEPPLEESARKSGRRLEDSVYESNDQNRYDGGLMKLTAKPTSLDAPISQQTYTPDNAMAEIVRTYQDKSSMDRMKAIQALLNMRQDKAVQSLDGRRMYANDQNAVQHTPMYDTRPKPEMKDIVELLSGKKFIPKDPTLYNVLNPARLAVPNQDIARNWNVARMFTASSPTLGLYNEIYPKTRPTYPGPIPANIGPIRPTPTAATDGRRAYSKPGVLYFTQGTASVKEKQYPAQSGEDTNSAEKMRELSRNKPEDSAEMSKPDEDYYVDASGLPVRKRRSRREIDSSHNPNLLLGKISESVMTTISEVLTIHNAVTVN